MQNVAFTSQNMKNANKLFKKYKSRKSMGSFNGFYMCNDRAGERARAWVNGTIRT